MAGRACPSQSELCQMEMGLAGSPSVHLYQRASRETFPSAQPPPQEGPPPCKVAQKVM